MDMERGKVRMVPLIAIVAHQNIEEAVAVVEIFGPHFPQLQFVMQKCYFALQSSLLEIFSKNHIIDGQNEVTNNPTRRRKVSCEDLCCYRE